MEEKGWLFHYARVLLGTDSEMRSRGIMRSVMKLWGPKVVDVPLYLPKAFYCGFVHSRALGSLLFFRNKCVARKRRTNHNFQILCSKIYTASHLQIFSLISIFDMHHCFFILFRK